MPKPKASRGRARPLLLVFLWIWVGCVALILDLFWNIDEFDRLRPRSGLYRGMRVAAHKMVGEAIASKSETRVIWRGALVYHATTPEAVRAMVRFCETATPADRSALLDVALHADDPLCAGNAIRGLGRLDAVADDPRVLALVRDGRSRVRHEVVIALGESSRASALGSLEPLLRHDDSKVRLLAIQALGKVGGEDVPALLQTVADDPSATKEERAFARAALRSTPP